jgi:hypothetical protein
MKVYTMLFCGAVCGLLKYASATPIRPELNLNGYMDEAGVVTVLHSGDSVDPYFAIQALLLAHENGMNVMEQAKIFANWLVARQKPDGTFDRYCRAKNNTWVACKTADADDALLAIWMKLLETMPSHMKQNPQLMKSYVASKASLDHLFQPSRGIYMVSPVYLHGLLMDNLEVWSLKTHIQSLRQEEADQLAQAIHNTFWDSVNKKYLVSTQLEQRTQKPAFYPDHVAQIYPQLMGFTKLPIDANNYYINWMKTHRADWLRQGEKDYPWGLIAVLALRQNDMTSARCWLRQSTPLRHSNRWAVTDETAYQILLSKGVTQASKGFSCA